MDLNDLRIAITLGSFVMFACIAAWAGWPRNQARFDEAARLPFHDQESES